MQNGRTYLFIDNISITVNVKSSFVSNFLLTTINVCLYETTAKQNNFTMTVWLNRLSPIKPDCHCNRDLSGQVSCPAALALQMPLWR